MKSDLNKKQNHPENHGGCYKHIAVYSVKHVEVNASNDASSLCRVYFIDLW